METVLRTLVVIGIIAAAVAAAVFLVRLKLNSLTRDIFGMNLKETSGVIKEGIRSEAEAPKAISNISAVYAPRLVRDFPDMTYERFLSMAEASLRNILEAIENEKPEMLTAVTDSFRTEIAAVISDNRGRGFTEHYDNINIHRSAISDYTTTSESATAVFELSYECIRYRTDGSGKRINVRDRLKKLPSDTPVQLAARVILSYGKEFVFDTSSLTSAHNCPNCGAPVFAVGEKILRCPYCGTGMSEDIYKSWLTDGYMAIK